MIDGHCHLNFHTFAEDVAEVVVRAKEAGVTTIVNVGTSLESSQQAIDLASQFDTCLAIVGIHPHHADKVTEGWLNELETLSKSPKVIGIGEIGMDFFSYKSNGIVDPKIQEEVFRKQIELAIQLSLPLQIHNRHAGKEVLRVLSDYRRDLQSPPGMFHCFAGDFNILYGALELGFYIGFDGNSTYPGLAPGETVALPELIKQTPLDRIMVETDSPYLTPVPLRGTRNEPKNAIIVKDFVAKIKGVEAAQLEEQIIQNFNTVFLNK